MKKALSFAAIAFMLVGGAAYACSGCGCEEKKADKEKSECGSSCKGDKQQSACGGSKKGNTGDKTACGGGSHKDAEDKKAA
jgi:hypothetical protein